jgi:hypothetical protein
MLESPTKASARRTNLIFCASLLHLPEPNDVARFPHRGASPFCGYGTPGGGELWASDVPTRRWVGKEKGFSIRRSLGGLAMGTSFTRKHLSNGHRACHSGEVGYFRSVGDHSTRLVVVHITVFWLTVSRCNCSFVDRHGDILFDIVDCKARRVGGSSFNPVEPGLGVRELTKSFDTGELVTLGVSECRRDNSSLTNHGKA